MPHDVKMGSVHYTKRVYEVTRTQIVRDRYRAFATGDRRVIEGAFANEFAFSSPLDVGLDRAGYFDR